VNTESQILQVPIEDIIPNRFQPRLNFDDSSLQELAASIKEHGIIQPLVLRKTGDKYEIIAGERRYKASQIAGLASVPAIITQMDDKKSAEVAIVENIQRRDLSSIEEARSYKSLLDKGYLTQEDLAKQMGISQSQISNKLRLLSLTEEVQQALMEGKISERHARSLLQVTNPEEQKRWLEKIITERLTVRDLEKKIKGKDDSKKPIVNINPNIEDIIKNAEDIVNTSIIKETPIKSEEEKQENRFFNPLESVSANMSVIDTPEEDIEMLDFLAPSDKRDNTSELLIQIKNYINSLNNNRIKLIEQDINNTHQIIITIE
jgi:ParB family transcriptional regulator, chromosome partitioning protein